MSTTTSLFLHCAFGSGASWFESDSAEAASFNWITGNLTGAAERRVGEDPLHLPHEGGKNHKRTCATEENHEKPIL